MKKTLIAALAAFALAPVAAFAAPTPAQQASKDCASLRAKMGVTPFVQAFGNAGTSNAFGKCVSKLAQQNEQEHSNAAAQCRTERSGGATAFAGKYGTGPNHKNAFGNCVSMKAKVAASARVEATINAATSCWTERKADLAAFKAHYGTNANKSNAFGKCVSGKVKQSSP